MRLPKPLPLIIVAGLIVSPLVHADQPYVTDNPRIADHGACRLEAGKRVYRGSRDEWLLPACNFTGNLELTLGLATETDVEATRTRGTAGTTGCTDEPVGGARFSQTPASRVAT
jgi:hypothetical protein